MNVYSGKTTSTSYSLMASCGPLHQKGSYWCEGVPVGISILII